jgi:hypothetical protein
MYRKPGTKQEREQVHQETETEYICSWSDSAIDRAWISRVRMVAFIWSGVVREVESCDPGVGMVYASERRGPFYVQSTLHAREVQ